MTPRWGAPALGSSVENDVVWHAWRAMAAPSESLWRWTPPFFFGTPFPEIQRIKQTILSHHFAAQIGTTLFQWAPGPER